MTGRGEVAIGITFIHDAIDQVLKGFPIVYGAPTDGTGYEIGGVSLVKGAPDRANASRFIDWALTPEAQPLAAERGQSFQIPSNGKWGRSAPPSSWDDGRVSDRHRGRDRGECAI